MHMQFVLASLCSIAAAAQTGPILKPRQFLNSSTTATTLAAPATTFGAAAAAIQNAIAAGLALKSSSAAAVAAAAQPMTTTAPMQASTSTSTLTVTSTSLSTIQAPGNIVTAPQPSMTRPGFTPIDTPAAQPTTAKMPRVTGASIGSQGTITVDGNVYTTAVVASYITVAAQPTTFYENGIAYVASYAGQTITVTDCPCTRSASIVFATTTVCSACDGSTMTTSGLPSTATDSSGATVVFTGSGSRSAAGLQTLLMCGVVILVAGVYM